MFGQRSLNGLIPEHTLLRSEMKVDCVTKGHKKWLGQGVIQNVVQIEEH